MIVPLNLCPVYLSGHLFSVGEKKFVILGEDPYFFAYNTQSQVEKRQNEVIMSELKYIASGTEKRVAVLLDSSDYLIEQARRAIDSIEDLDEADKPLVGINITLPLFAQACQDHYGILDFRHVDGRGKSLLLAQETISTMLNVLRSLRHKKIRLGNEGLLTSEKQKKKVLKNNEWRKKIKKQIFLYCPPISFKDYFDTINMLIENNTCNDYMDGQLLHYCQLAFNYLKKYKATDRNFELKRVFWRMFKKEKIANFNKNINEWINPIFQLSQTRKLKDSIQNSLTTYNYVVVSCNHNFAVTLYNYFSHSKYALDSSIGYNEIIDETARGYCACSPKDIESIFKDINMQVSSSFKLQHCQSCFKQETSPNRHLVCNRCKERWYCSKGCQKNDWQKHKLTCIAK